MKITYVKEKDNKGSRVSAFLFFCPFCQWNYGGQKLYAKNNNTKNNNAKNIYAKNNNTRNESAKNNKTKNKTTQKIVTPEIVIAKIISPKIVFCPKTKINKLFP